MVTALSATVYVVRIGILALAALLLPLRPYAPTPLPSEAKGLFNLDAHFLFRY